MRGEIEFTFRVDRSLRAEWDKIANPQAASSLLGGYRLASNMTILTRFCSKYLLFFTNNVRGAKHIIIDPVRLPFYFDLKPIDFVELREAGLLQPEAPVKVPRLRIDYHALAEEYRKKLDDGGFATRADLARSLGVSQTWIAKVMNRQTKAG